MTEKFYPDTSIWLDIYEKRGKNGETALKLFTKIIEESNIILYSNALIKELKNLEYFQTEINEILSKVDQNNIRQVQITKKQIDEAEKISTQRNIPKRDVLHAIAARDNESHLITRDNHFQKLKDITTPKLPEAFI